MTLTHLLPSLRRSIPDPFDQRIWPHHTSVSLDDMTVAGVSLKRLVMLCGTPCVHTTDQGSVIIARIEAIDGHDGRTDVWVDAALERCAPAFAEARLIGRITSARPIAVTLLPTAVTTPSSWLPADITIGDLVAIPTPLTVALHELHRDALHPDRTTTSGNRNVKVQGHGVRTS